MGRNRAPPKAASKPAAAPAAPKPAAAPAKPATPAQQPPQQHDQPMQPQHTTVIMAPQQRGPGMMGTMAAAAAGSVAGSYISNQMFGGHGQPPAEAPAQPQQVQQNDPCASQFMAFNKCLENNGTNESCNWAWDMVKTCRTQNGFQ